MAFSEPGPVPQVTGAALLLRQAKKELKALDAANNLLDFIQYCMPDPDKFHIDELASLYDVWPHHQLIIDLFTRTITGECLRGALSVPPQHGKTTVCAEYGIAFYAAKHPEHKIIYGTYSESRAAIVGEKVRSIMESERFREVFPDFKMKKGSKSKDLVGFGIDGSVMFLGRNSGASGNPCNLFIIDDPFKDRREAKSKAIREEVWDWYCSVVEARCPMQTPIFIIHTRWSDDDLIGRLCDKDHPNYDPEDHDEFEYLNLPAIIYDPDLAALLGLELVKDSPDAPPRAALWPGHPDNQKWPIELLLRIQKRNPTVFSAVYMGNPVPPDGDFYTKDMIEPYTYKRSKLPENLRYYGASDHAVSIAKRADSSVIGTAGMDENGELWVHPDLVWEKIESHQQVQEMVRICKARRPISWWSEGDHIKKTLGPFLKRALRKAKVFTTVFRELSKSGDKQEKSQSIRAMFAMGMVHLPSDVPWYDRALAQMLRFDGSEGRPDDFCDFLGNIGRGLDLMQAPQGDDDEDEEEKIPETGSPGWVKMAAKEEGMLSRAKKAIAGW